MVIYVKFLCDVAFLLTLGNVLWSYSQEK